MIKLTPCRNPAVLVLLVTAAVREQIPEDNTKKPPPKYDPVSVGEAGVRLPAPADFVTDLAPRAARRVPISCAPFWSWMMKAESDCPSDYQGRPEKGMPRFALPAQQIADISNFLHDSIEKTKDRDNYKILNIVTGDPKAGEAYFVGRGGCSACHAVTGDLKGIASKYDPITLQGKFLQPNYSWMEGTPPQKVFAVSVTVTLPDGKSTRECRLLSMTSTFRYVTRVGCISRSGEQVIFVSIFIIDCRHIWT